MIPILDLNGHETGEFKNTKADAELTPLNSLWYIKIKRPIKPFDIVNMPVWYFIERYCRIKDKSGKILAFELNDAQIECYKILCEQRKQHRPMRLDILKARQLGMSTFIAAINVTTKLLVANQKAVIVANQADNASILLKIYTDMYELFPERIRKTIPKVTYNAKGIAVSHGVGRESSIRIAVAGENTGRGGSVQAIHFSEVAFWECEIKTVIQSLVQTVDMTNLDSLIIFETTANGVNDYKLRWDRDYGGGTPYKAVFFPRYTEKNYRMPYTNFDLTDFEEEMMKEYGLDLEQISWYHYKWLEAGDLETMRQEFPSSPNEAFITSGHSFFAMDLIQKRKAELIGKTFPCGEFRYNKMVAPEGDAITITNIAFATKRNGLITIFKEAVRGHPYIVNTDPNMAGEDYFVAQVFDNATFEQVAVLSINKCSDYDWLSIEVYCLCKYYNDALLNAETNNSTGTFVLETCLKCGHTFIYQDSSVETLSVRYEDKLGYKTKSSNKEYLTDLVQKAFRDKPDFINDYETLCEMETFQVVRLGKNGKEQRAAVGGGHDDRVMALCGIFLARRSMLQTTLITEESNKRATTIEELELLLDQRRLRQHASDVVRKVNMIWD